jgi:hypothetical protein
MKGEIVMEEVTTGVNESVAAGQTTEQNVQETTQQGTGEQQTQENSGVETKPAAGVNEGVEKAFAARLKEATEKAKQEARDAYIAEQGYVWNGKPITTEAEYKQALYEKELMERYQSQGLPEDVVQELVESKKFREQYHAQQKTAEQKAATEKMYQEFLDAYPDIKGEDIPAEAWKEVQQGKNLLDAYVRHENKLLREQLKGFQAKEQAAQVNQANAKTSPGSVTGNGNSGPDFISHQTFEANKHDQSWVNKNFSKIMQSRAKW